jgi:hypothetical protein
MTDWVISILWYVLVAFSAGMFILAMSVIGFCFWTASTWNECMKRDDKDDKCKKRERWMSWHDNPYW